MLLTITCRGPGAEDLGYLLHKNPDRPQQFELNCGRAYVFYPKAGADETTAALLLDMDPVALARGKVGSRDGGLFDYVNDRPYVASSFLSTALVRVFGTAMSGRCDQRPDAALQPLDLEATLSMLPCGSPDAVCNLFEPLGYTVSCSFFPLDETFPRWGESRYANLIIRGQVRLSELLNHLYVLIPVFDGQKHYWMADDEVEKLLKHGEGWLGAHPARELITRRYFRRKQNLANQALIQLIEAGERDEEADKRSAALVDFQPSFPSLNAIRLQAVSDTVGTCGARSVLDLGCGEGRLLSLLLQNPRLERVAGADVSTSALARAAGRLKTDRMPPWQRNKLTLFHASATYRDKRFEGYDAILLVEVLEHLDPSRLGALEEVLFRHAAPGTAVVTTPNAEYNINYETLKNGGFRHEDHRFEWSRAQFRQWAEETAARYGYTVTLSQLGAGDGVHGSPTQMGVFHKCG